MKRLGLGCLCNGRFAPLGAVLAAVFLCSQAAAASSVAVPSPVIPLATTQEGTSEQSAVKALRRIADALALAADRAHRRAQEGELLAKAARRRSNEAGAALRRLRKELGLPPAEPVQPPPRTGEAAKVREKNRVDVPVAPKARLLNRLAAETHKHAAAGRSAAENKALYLPRERAAHRLSGRRRTAHKGGTFSPGEAPDMGDLDISATWQWAINVARGGTPFAGKRLGSVQKTGHVDLARLSIQPSTSKDAVAMLWGLRRYNLGDTTVTDCDFSNITREHAIYDEVSGHALYRGNTFLRIGGQAIQMAYRDKPFAQYMASNMPYTGRATYVLDGNHAVDTGLHGSRSGFVWTFFDPGTHAQPATVVLRDCTSVQAWGKGRGASGPGSPTVRSPGGLVVHHYQHVNAKAAPATETVAIDNCLFDHTLGSMPVMALRGVGTILIEDSCFLAREHRNPVIDIDDLPNMPSGKVILENNVSPEGMEVFLHVRGKRVCSMHCPGKRIEIDVRTLEMVESEPKEDLVTRLISPLANRSVAPGVHPQPLGHIDDIGTVKHRYR